MIKCIIFCGIISLMNIASMDNKDIEHNYITVILEQGWLSNTTTEIAYNDVTQIKSIRTIAQLKLAEINKILVSYLEPEDNPYRGYSLAPYYEGYLYSSRAKKLSGYQTMKYAIQQYNTETFILVPPQKKYQ